MTTRFRRMSVTAVALVVGVGLGAAGCGKYSPGSLMATKAFKDANAKYAAQDWKEAAEQVRGGAQQRPELRRGPLLPGQQLRQPLQAGPQGRGRERRATCRRRSSTTSMAAEKDPVPGTAQAGAPVPRRRLRPREAGRPVAGRADRQADDRARAERADQLLRPRPSCTRTPAATTRPSRRCSRPATSSRTTRSSTPRSPATTTARGTSRRRSTTSRRPPSSTRRTPRAST